MKILLVLVSLLIGVDKAQAVVTANCPQIIQMEISNFQDHSWDSPSSVVLEGTLELTSTESSNCYYRNVSGEGELRSARIEGSVKDNAKEPAYLVVYYNFSRRDFAAYMDVTSMNKTAIEISSKANVTVATEKCYYGCVTTHTSIGNAEFNYVADY